MSTEHPDEGTIHAWLEGALDDIGSSRLAEHVRGCPACLAATAEARGLIAGASRVVKALDPVAQGSTGPGRGMRTSAAALPRGSRGGEPPASLWRRLRVTPARAAIAATLLVVAGLTLARDRTAKDAFPPPAAVQAAPPTLAAAAARDPLLDSAIRRNVAAALPRREVGAAPGVSVPVAGAPASPGAVADQSAPARVAEGRAEARVATEAAPASRDALAAGNMTARSMASPAAVPAARCLRVEPVRAGDARPGVPLPGLLELDPDGSARLAMAPGSASVGGSWRSVGDSVVVNLRGDHLVALAHGVGERRGRLASPAGDMMVVANEAPCEAR